MPVRIIVVLIAVITVLTIFLAIFVGTAEGAEEATTCEGAMRAIASMLRDRTGAEIC